MTARRCPLPDKEMPYFLSKVTEIMAESGVQEREMGFTVCSRDGKIVYGKTCKGTICEMDVAVCKGKRLASFHTHPRMETEYHLGSADIALPSPGDLGAWLVSREHFLCLGDPNKGVIRCWPNPGSFLLLLAGEWLVDTIDMIMAEEKKPIGEAMVSAVDELLGPACYTKKLYKPLELEEKDGGIGR